MYGFEFDADFVYLEYGCSVFDLYVRVGLLILF